MNQSSVGSHADAKKGIHYTEFTDVQKMLEMGMDMMPVLQVGKKQYGFKEAIKIVGGM